MIDTDLTLPSPGTQLAPPNQALLALTVLWHPQIARVGEQAVLHDVGQPLQLNRFLPVFRAPGALEGLPLGERCIGREPLLLQRRGEDLLLQIPAGRMQVDIAGQPAVGERLLSRALLAEGVVLGLGGAVLLCLHWVQALPRAGEQAGLIGVSSAMVRVREQIRQVADTDLAVLLLGETGTGKELAARAIHTASRRRTQPWVSVNMATLSESLAAADLFGASKGAYTGAETARQGYFAEAGAGTLFLDEIGNTPEPVQPMLLRVLETGEYRPLGAARNELSQARLVAATDQRLDAGEFNQPLLRRLEAFVIRLPALRERREDIGLLIVHLLAQWQAQSGVAVNFEADFVRELCCYDWPGNVRQLANVVRRAALARQADDRPSLGELLGVVVGMLPVTTGLELVGEVVDESTPTRRTRLAELSSAQLIDALEQQAWQIKGAAAVLGISRPSLYKLLEAHPDIRSADAIDEAELLTAWDATGELTTCASRLRTPAEALRRRLRALGCGA